MREWVGWVVNGMNREEISGLQSEERKRKRSEARVSKIQFNINDGALKDSIFSKEDCLETNKNFLTTLVEKASHPQSNA